jgi:chromosome segregation ATPase
MVMTQSVALARSQATLAGQSRLSIAHTQLQGQCRQLSSQLHDCQQKLAHLNGLLTEREEIVRAQSADLTTLRDRLAVARAREESAHARAYAADQTISSGVSVTTQLEAFRDDYSKLLADRMPCGDCKRRISDHKEEKKKWQQQYRTLEVALRLEGEKRSFDDQRRRERERDRRTASSVNGALKAVNVERIEATLTHQDPETGLWATTVTCPRHVHQHDCPALRSSPTAPLLRACDAYAAAYQRALRGVDLTGCLVFRPVLPRDE